MKTIEPVRGDTIFIAFPLVDQNGAAIFLEEIDTMFLTAREFPRKTSPILFNKTKEDFTFDESDGKFNIIIQPKDTEELEIDEFYFDIEVTLNDGTRQTENYKAILEKDCTIHGGDADGN